MSTSCSSISNTLIPLKYPDCHLSLSWHQAWSAAKHLKLSFVVKYFLKNILCLWTRMRDLMLSSRFLCSMYSSSIVSKLPWNYHRYGTFPFLDAHFFDLIPSPGLNCNSVSEEWHPPWLGLQPITSCHVQVSIFQGMKPSLYHISQTIRQHPSFTLSQRYLSWNPIKWQELDSFKNIKMLNTKDWLIFNPIFHNIIYIYNIPSWEPALMKIRIKITT